MTPAQRSVSGGVSASVPTTQRRRLLLRVLAGIVTMLALGGPSPGHVGSCDGGSELADTAEFCEVYRTFYCTREYAGGRMALEAYNACTSRSPSGAYTYCVTNPFDACQPLKRETDACVRGLADDSDEWSTPSTAIPQCQICGGI